MTDNIDDLFIYYLRRHLEILDVEIAEILAKIGTSNDPEGDGYYDTGEYFMGAGLAAGSSTSEQRVAQLRMLRAHNE